MPNTIKRIRPPVGWTAQQLIDLLGTNARIHAQRAPTETGAFSDLAAPFKTLVAGTENYEMPDPAGLSSSWYRIRFESLDGTLVQDWKTHPAEYA